MNKNLPLIVGIALPVVLIAAISVAIFVPSLSIRPAHSFLYTLANPYSSYAPAPYGEGYKKSYDVENGHLAEKPVPAPKGQAFLGDAPPLYLYDMAAGASHKISLADAANYSLDPGPSSPDGYFVNYEYGRGGFLFFDGGGDGGYYAEKGTGRRRLPGIGSSSEYPGSFVLVGWIK